MLLQRTPYNVKALKYIHKVYEIKNHFYDYWKAWIYHKTF